MDSTRTSRARASRGATTRRAFCVSPTSRLAHRRDSPARAFRSAGVARASGKGPRRDSRSVGQRRKDEPPLGQHRQAWQPARSHDQAPQLCEDNHRGRRLWRRGDGLGGLGGVRGLGAGGAGACLTLRRPHSRQTPQHTDAILSKSHEQAQRPVGPGRRGGRRLPRRRSPRVWVHIRRALSQ